MPIRSLPSLLVAVLALGAAGASRATAAPLPRVYGPADGIQATAAGRTVTISFAGDSAALGRSLARKSVDLTCERVPLTGLAFTDDGVPQPGGSGHGTVSADGATLTVTIDGRPGDVCDVSSAPIGTAPAARAAITPGGAVWADEQRHARQLLDVAYGARPTTAYRSSAALVAQGHGAVVALDGPDGTPPPGTVGYWTDGRTRATFATLSDAGRRLVLQDLGRATQRTNVFAAEQAYVTAVANATTRFSPITGADVTAGYTGKVLTSGDGVRSTIAGGDVVVRFTGRSRRAYRTIAGHRAGYFCEALPVSLLIGAATSSPGIVAGSVHVPRRGAVVRLPARGADLCQLVAPRPVTLVTPTARGRRRLREFTDVAAFTDLIPDTLAGHGATVYPAARAIVAGRFGLVALATPGGRVDHGTAGIWTDGARQAVVATTDSRGHRLVLADEGDGIVRSNILPFLFDTLALELASP